MYQYHQPPIMTDYLDKEAIILQIITVHLLKRNVDIELNPRPI